MSTTGLVDLRDALLTDAVGVWRSLLQDATVVDLAPQTSVKPGPYTEDGEFVVGAGQQS